ncbi:MAG TPA: hypothetical protein PKY81_17735, partial [bacterium]|nr:hypothetical protein [bacterium]
TTSSTTDSKTAAGGGQNTIVFNDADLAAYGNGMNIDDFFVGFTVSLTAGHGYSQTKTITAYNSATRTATLDSDWTTTKDRARNGAALNTIKIDNTSELDDLNFTGATVKILSGAAAGETRVVNSYDAGTNTLTLSSAWNTNITGAVAGAGSGTNTLVLEIGDLKNYDNYYYGASVTLTAGITNITKTISGYAKTTNEITVDSDWGVITEQGIANHGGAASAATANTITFAAGASASNNAYVGSTINVNGEIKTITAYNGATQTATVDSDWLDGDGSSIVGQDYALTVEINEHSSYVINDVIANSSSTYEITLASGNYNVPKNGTTYSLNSTGLYAIDLNESSANYLTPYNTGILISGGDSSSLYDITEYDSGKYSILFNDYSDSNKVKIYNFEGSTEQNIFHTSSISVIKNTGSGTALGATANTIQLAATASDIANTYVGSIITVNNESKTITAYDNITKTATVDGAWSDGDGSTISGHNYAFIKDLGIQGGSLSSSYLDADGKMAVLKFTESGYVQSTSNQYITLESSANSQNGYYVGMQVNIGSNVRTITSYNGTTKQAVLDEPLSSRTTATSKYSISHSIMYFDVSDTNYSDAGSITELPDTLTKTTVMPEIFKSSDGKYYIGYSEVAEENTLLEYNNSSMNTIQLSPTSSNEDDYYVGMGFYISNGPGAGTLNTIIDYDGTTKTATIENTFIGTSNCSITAIGATTIKSGALTAATNDYYNNWGIYITDGTGAGQFRRITDYDGTTKTATVESWDITPDTNSKFKLMQLPNTATFNTNNEFTALSGTLTNIRFPVGFNTYNTFYKGYTVFLTGGTGAGQYRDISAYVGTGGAARTATVATNWTTAPVGGNTKFTLMLTDSSAPYTGSSDTAVMQTAN